MQLVAAFGLSSPFTYWGFGLVQKALEQYHSDLLRIHGTSIDDLRNGLQGRNGRPVMFSSDNPAMEVVELFAKAGPVIVFQDDSIEPISFALETRGANITGVLSFITACICGQVKLFKERSNLHLRRSDYENDVPRLIEDVFSFLDGNGDAARLTAFREAVLADFPSEHMSITDYLAYAVPQFSEARNNFSALPPKTRSLLEKTLASYAPILNGAAFERIEWDPFLFYMDAKDDGSRYIELTAHGESRQIDLTGPGRFLFWGPYLHLPPGRWVANIEFEVDQNVSGNLLEADVTVAGEKYAASGVLPQIGVYEFNIDFEVLDAHQAIEVRGVLCKGAIEGLFLLRKVVISKATQQKGAYLQRSSLAIAG